MADFEKYKLSSLYWKGDKNEEGVFVYLENFGSMVRSTASGYHLEGMLDSKLRRASILKGGVPSCLLMDPDFAAFSPSAPELLAPGEVVGEAPAEADTLVWMDPIRPLIVSEIENFERPHDHISPYLTGTRHDDSPQLGLR